MPQSKDMTVRAPAPLSTEPARRSADRSVAMLRAVVEGETYEVVAARFGLSRTAVERRIKRVAVELSKTAGVAGLNEDGAAFVRRLRTHRDAILAALPLFRAPQRPMPHGSRILGPDEIVQAARRIKVRSSRPAHDLALFYLLFATGARPLEIARLEVQDYLEVDGGVRCESRIRAGVAISGKPRALFFTSTLLNEAMDAYLLERRSRGLGVGGTDSYRGLDPQSRLFLSPSGEGYRICPYGETGQRRFLCRPMIETCSRLFRYGGLHGASALSARRTLVHRLDERGADEGQIGSLLGIGQRSAVRIMLAKQKPGIDTLVKDLL